MSAPYAEDFGEILTTLAANAPLRQAVAKLGTYSLDADSAASVGSAPDSCVTDEDGVTWTKRQFSDEVVRKAGEWFRQYTHDQLPNPTVDEYKHSLRVLHNWRAAHHYPLNAIHTNLRNQVKAVVHGEPLTAQRIKRTPAILDKVSTNAKVDLVVMQDIGGCRAIVETLDQVYAVRKRILECHAKHKFLREDDYIKGVRGNHVGPNKKGYRGLHLIYSYKGKTEYNGIPIEIQLRTQLQHLWGTSNEVAGLMKKQQFKSGRGDSGWLRMFKLWGSVFALEEGTPTTEGTPDNIDDLRREIRALNDEIRFTETLESFAAGVRLVQKKELKGVKKQAHYFLLQLSLSKQLLYVNDYTKKEVREAERQLAKVESEIRDGKSDIDDAVLVTARELGELASTYPNYYLDTTLFIARVKAFVGAASSVLSLTDVSPPSPSTEDTQ